MRRSSTVSISRSFTTGRDDQPTFEIVIVRTSGAAGVDAGVHRRLEVRGLRPAPRGQVEVEVTFAVDHAGEVTVTAVDAQTGQAYVVAS